MRGIVFDPTTTHGPGEATVYAVGYGSLGPPYAADQSDTGAGIYKSLDGGASWANSDAGVGYLLGGVPYTGVVRDIALDPRSCNAPPASGPCIVGPLHTLYVAADGQHTGRQPTYRAARIYKSTDAGVSWTVAETGLPNPCVPIGDGYTACSRQRATSIVIDPQTPTTLYVGLAYNGRTLCDCELVNLPNGVFKSTNGGAHWMHRSVGLPALDAEGTTQWNVSRLAIDPTAPSTLYVGVYEDVGVRRHGRLYKSTDAGATWRRSDAGIAGFEMRSIVIDPAQPSTVYVATNGSLTNPSGVFRSIDGGATWNSFSIGLAPDGSAALALDPHRPGRVLLGTYGGLATFDREPDADSDGAPTSIEAAAPNAGDGNADGVQDAMQSNVASLAGVGDATKGGPDPRVTITLAPASGRCLRINDAQLLSADALPADIARGVAPTAFDRGIVRFSLPDCSRAVVIVQFHGADHGDDDWVWRNDGPSVAGEEGSIAWYTFPGARKIAPDTWQLTIDAGQRGNVRNDADNIVFVGAPGFVDISVFRDGLE